MRQSNKLANKLWLASLFVRIRGSPAISPLRFEVDFERCTHGARSRSPAEIRASYARKVKQYNAPPGAPPRHYRRPPLSPAPDLSPFFRLSSFPLDTHLSSSPFLFRLLSFLPRSAVERERERAESALQRCETFYRGAGQCAQPFLSLFPRRPLLRRSSSSSWLSSRSRLAPIYPRGGSAVY